MRKLEMNQMATIEGGQVPTLPDLSVLLAQVLGFVLVLLPLLAALVGFALTLNF